MRRVAVTSLAAAIVCAACAAAQAAKVVARVTEVRGDVKIQDSDGAVRSAITYTSVRENDAITLGDKSAVAVAFRSDGHIERLDRAGKVMVAADGMKPAANVEIVKTAKLPQAKIGSWVSRMPESVGGVSTLRGGADEVPPRITPMAGQGDDVTIVANRRPTFSWPADPQAVRYLFKLSSGSETTWKCEPKENTVQLASAELLTGEIRYTWSVSSVRGNREKHTIVAAAAFAIGSAEDFQAAGDMRALSDSNSFSALTIAASIYVRLRMYDEALPLFERLAKQNPDDPVFQQALFGLYGRAGHGDESKAAANRLKALIDTRRKRNARSDSGKPKAAQ